MNLRSKSKGIAVVPKVPLKTEATDPTPFTMSDNADLSEATLRKLPRAELQKLAMAHKVKANTKSELIIRQLSSLHVPGEKRRAENDPKEGPSRKRLKREATPEEVASRTAEKQVAHLDTPPAQSEPEQQTSVEGSQPEPGSSAPRSMSPVQTAPTRVSYDKDIFSGTESEATEEEQLDFATPVSSRAGTPLPANAKDLERCVKIMQEISGQDIALLSEVTEVRETAVKLRKRARDVRELVKAETGRRERMEAYFRYWQETEPLWDRRWLHGEKMVPDYKIQLEESDKPAGPPTVLVGRGHAQPVTPARGLMRNRELIISRQEAEQRQLEALQ